MIEDANKIPSGSSFAADLCIVGAGAAGIGLALQFTATGLDVLLVESGGMKESSATHALYKGEVVNPAWHPPAHRYRHRVFGGSTVVWGGRCMPYDPVDFEDRPWVPHSAWPIRYDEVTPYYPAAMRLVEAGEFIFSAAAAVPGGMRPMLQGFTPTNFSCDAIERFSRPTNFAARYGDALKASGNVRVLLNANCVKIETSQDGTKVTKLVLRTLGGKQFEVEAKQNILAMGGLEIPRLLLSSHAPLYPNGLGNAEDNVGRYYMSHIAGTIGTLQFALPRDGISHGYERSSDGVYCRRRIALLAETQKRYGIGNLVFRLHHPRLADHRHKTGILSLIYLAKPFISYQYGKRLYGSEELGCTAYLRHITNVLGSPLSTAGFLLNWSRVRLLAERKYPTLIVRPRTNIFSLDFHGEQVPNPDSRIMLANERDALGMPRIRIDWRYSPLDIRTVSAGLKLLRDELARWGGGRLKFAPDEVEHCMLRDGAFGGHHIGTARMSNDPAMGVVDADCRLHGLENLYIAGSAVFPTSGQANPTLTIIAMTLRVADHLKRRYGLSRAANVRQGTPAKRAPALVAPLAPPS